MSHITVAYESEERNRVALYVDSIKVIECQAYELDTLYLLTTLRNEGLLSTFTELDEIEFDYSDFPATLSEAKDANDWEPQGSSSKAE